MITLQNVEHPTQLKDLDYMLELAEHFLEGSCGQWPIRIERYRELLQARIRELEDGAQTD